MIAPVRREILDSKLRPIFEMTTDPEHQHWVLCSTKLNQALANPNDDMEDPDFVIDSAKGAVTITQTHRYRRIPLKGYPNTAASPASTTVRGGQSATDDIAKFRLWITQDREVEETLQATRDNDSSPISEAAAQSLWNWEEVKIDQTKDSACPIQLEEWGETCHPVGLACGHEFSKEALVDMVNRRARLECPICRKPAGPITVGQMPPGTMKVKVCYCTQHTASVFLPLDVAPMPPPLLLCRLSTNHD